MSELLDSFDSKIEPSISELGGKKRPAAKKKYTKKHIASTQPCPHCGDILPFPSFYCVCCKDHRHTLFQSNKDKDWCSDCNRGITSQGQAYMRAHRTWQPHIGIAASYDFPEWYEGQQELSASTIMPLWINDELDNII
jgi:hypothetical protein